MSTQLALVRGPRLAFVVPGPPVPKARARAGKGGRHYTPQKTRDYEAHTKSCMQAALMRAHLLHTWPLGERFDVETRIYFPNARTRDADNVIKSILDAGRRTLWADDNSKYIGKRTDHAPEIDRANPRVEVVVDVVYRERGGR